MEKEGEEHDKESKRTRKTTTRITRIRATDLYEFKILLSEENEPRGWSNNVLELVKGLLYTYTRKVVADTSHMPVH